MPSVLSSSLATVLALVVSTFIMMYLVLRSSSIVAVQLENALRDSEQNYAQLVRGLKDYAVFLLDADGHILVWNPGAERMTGQSASEVIGKKVTTIFSNIEAGLKLGHALEQVRSTGVFRIEGWAERKDAPLFWAETVLSRLTDEKGRMTSVSVIIRDDTEQREAEKSMKTSLLEKEVLLQEIHHRVKNNLQVISSLLRLQSETVDKKTASLFMDSQERVRAMSMVHEYLYKSNDLSRINFPAYVASLVRNLYRTFGLASKGPPPQVEVEEADLALDVAVPCGLLLTELISNAAKYAYPTGEGGPLRVGFRKSKDGFFELSVADQGIGFPEGFDWTVSDSLGLRLIRLLTEQLQGQAHLDNRGGVKATVTFKDTVPQKIIDLEKHPSFRNRSGQEKEIGLRFANQTGQQVKICNGSGPSPSPLPRGEGKP